MYGGEQRKNDEVKNFAKAGLGALALGAATHSPAVGLFSFAGFEALQHKKELFGMKGGKQRPTKRSPKRGASRPRRASKKWIQSVVRSKSFHSGSFTRQAAAHQMTTKAFMREVLAHPTRYSLTTRRRAQFLKNIQRSK